MWWDDNGPHVNGYDKDGFDSYGYDKNGRDRAGHTEEEYESSTNDLFEEVFFSYGNSI